MRINKIQLSIIWLMLSIGLPVLYFGFKHLNTLNREIVQARSAYSSTIDPIPSTILKRPYTYMVTDLEGNKYIIKPKEFPLTEEIIKREIAARIPLTESQVAGFERAKELKAQQQVIVNVGGILLFEIISISCLILVLTKKNKVSDAD